MITLVHIARKKIFLKKLPEVFKYLLCTNPQFVYLKSQNSYIQISYIKIEMQKD